QAQVVGTYAMTYPTSDLRRWVARLGYDSLCGVGGGTTSCAWFTWTDGTTPDSAWVNWAAVSDQGIVDNLHWAQGTDGSGDVGIFFEGDKLVRSQLLAYISRDRRTVMYRLLDAQGGAQSPVTLQTIADACYEAYQTAVVWSPRERRFLVVWSEADRCSSQRNGRVRSRWVDGFGVTMQSSTQHLLYCENDPLNPGCLRGKAAGDPKAIQSSVAATPTPKPDDGGIKPDQGTKLDTSVEPPRTSNCSCKGLFVAASWAGAWGTAVDRYRVHVYGWHVRLTGDGLLASWPDRLDSGCEVYCPMDHRWPAAAPYAQAGEKMSSGNNYVEMRYLLNDSLTTQLEDTIHDYPRHIPQALRTTPNAWLIATLATEGREPSKAFPLVLTISDGGTGGGCP
ncbi:MAG: hypothetical protein KAI47_04610, partial [Deltaproteobacteria bacterium]|nr:hypothetical protein [Deltaproteobacteria bacterium]